MSHPFDAITLDHLRAVGGLKWSAFPQAVGAFVAEMDFGTAPAVTRALRRAVDDAALGYLPRPLAARMAEACADWYSQVGWQVDPEWIEPITDGLSALQIAVEMFCPPDAPVVLPTPAYMPFLTRPGQLGRRLVTVPLVPEGTGHTLDLDAVERALSGGGLFLLCNPHNPLGHVLDEAEMTALAQVVDRCGARVLSDEIHAPLVYPGARHVPYASLDGTTACHTLTMISAAKAWNIPGLKCAQVVLSSPADRRAWEQTGQSGRNEASTLGVVAADAAFRDGREWLADVLAYLDGNRRLVADWARTAPGVEHRTPEGTYLAWLDCRGADLPEAAVTFFAERAGVVGTDGRACGAPDPGFLRLNFAMPRPILREALESMARALAEIG